MFDYRVATSQDLEQIWNYSIKANAGDIRWVNWKTAAMADNANGKSKTFVVVKDNVPIGGMTFTAEQAHALVGKIVHTKDVGYLYALRIMKQYEGQGHISKLFKMVQKHAKSIGMKALIIGCEAKETRNLAIYLHWGFNEFIESEIDHEENDALVLYYKKYI
jgi:GNAT superfamily N-acetyltransferase